MVIKRLGISSFLPALDGVIENHQSIKVVVVVVLIYFTNSVASQHSQRVELANVVSVTGRKILASYWAHISMHFSDGPSLNHPQRIPFFWVSSIFHICGSKMHSSFYNWGLLLTDNSPNILDLEKWKNSQAEMSQRAFGPAGHHVTCSSISDHYSKM